MAADLPLPADPSRLWGLRGAALLAFLVALLSSLNLYLLEDDNPLTQVAYSASPLLRFSYDGVYLSALVAGVAACAIVGYSLARPGAPVLPALAGVAILTILGGFGGLLVRHPPAFLALVAAFAILASLSFLVGAMVAAHARLHLGRQRAAIVGACAGASVALLVNLAVLIPHTLALNPISHPLYMQGQIGATHLNSLLFAMGLEALALLACMLSLVTTLRRAAR